MMLRVCNNYGALVVTACSVLLTVRPVALSAELILIKGGTVVNAEESLVADVLINGTLIEAVQPDLEAPSGCTVIDASNKLVMPGGIDPHTHLSMPFMGTVAADDFFSGQAAALAGGTTMHIDFVLPVEHDIERGLASYREKVKRGCSDYGLHVAVTAWNDKVSNDMAAAVDAGINSFKFFLAYKGALMVTDEQFLQGLRRCKELGALAMVHCENGEAVAMGQQDMLDAGVTGPIGHALSRPSFVEGEATGRAIALARAVDTPIYIVHVMSKDALDEVVAARLKGQRVIGEPTAAGLALEEGVMWQPDFLEASKYVMSPPIRSAEHREALKAALAGGMLHLVATDHAVFNTTQKALGKDDFRLIPNGVNGLEERLHVIWNDMVNTGMLTPSDFVRVTSTQCAKIFNIYPRKGVVAAGSDADVIVFDPEATHTISASTHHSALDYNVFEGFKIKGRVVRTISRGRIVWVVPDGAAEGELRVSPGTSRFVPTPPGGYLFDGLEHRATARKSQAYSSARVSAMARDEL